MNISGWNPPLSILIHFIIFYISCFITAYNFQLFSLQSVWQKKILDFCRIFYAIHADLMMQLFGYLQIFLKFAWHPVIKQRSIKYAFFMNIISASHGQQNLHTCFWRPSVVYDMINFNFAVNWFNRFFFFLFCTMKKSLQFKRE